MAGVKLDMTKPQVLAKWGKTTCDASTCTWEGPGTRGQNERAFVSFVNGKAVQITISSATKGNNLKFKPGVLSKFGASPTLLRAAGTAMRSVADAGEPLQAGEQARMAQGQPRQRAVRHLVAATESRPDRDRRRVAVREAGDDDRSIVAGARARAGGRLG
jgi:hypothetical protein